MCTMGCIGGVSDIKGGYHHPVIMIIIDENDTSTILLVHVLTVELD